VSSYKKRYRTPFGPDQVEYKDGQEGAAAAESFYFQWLPKSRNRVTIPI
jgi:hypothetical protein